MILKKENYMSVSINVEGIRDLDVNFKKMYDVLIQCKKAGVSLPKEVVAYFRENCSEEYDIIDEEYLMREDYSKEDLAKFVRTVDLYRYMSGSVMYDDGATISLDKIPSDVKTLRIYAEA